MSSAVGRLVRAELRLMTRDPLVLTFVFVFPIVTMLIIVGAFGTSPDAGFDNVNPAHWHLASYRERGVLRRFAAAGFPRWSFAIAQLIVGLLTTAVACVMLLIVAAPVYGVPAVHDPWRVAVGLLIFFPSFLLGAGGPPPHVMGSVVRQVAGPLPLTLLTNAVRAPWLGLGPATGSLIAIAALAVAASAVAAR